MAETFIKDKVPINFKFDNWCVDAGIVADDRQNIKFVQCRDEEQSLSNLKRERLPYTMGKCSYGRKAWDRKVFISGRDA